MNADSQTFEDRPAGDARRTPNHLLPLNYHGTETRAVVFGKICPICAGPLFVPKRGRAPETCSAKCRKAKSRLGNR